MAVSKAQKLEDIQGEKLPESGPTTSGKPVKLESHNGSTVTVDADDVDKLIEVGFSRVK